MKKFLALVIVSLMLEGAVWALPSDRSLMKEYASLVEKASLSLQRDGKDRAFAAINDSKGEFVNSMNNLYVYVLDAKGDMVSHSTNKLLIGMHFLDIRDAEGKLFYQEIIKEASKNGSGWVSFKLQDPVTKKAERKDCYFKKQGDYIVVCSTK